MTVMEWNTDMSKAPEDRPLLLDLGADRGFAYVQWCEAWGLWIEPGDVADASAWPSEVYGIGRAIPVAWLEPVHS